MNPRRHLDFFGIEEWFLLVLADSRKFEGLIVQSSLSHCWLLGSRLLHIEVSRGKVASLHRVLDFDSDKVVQDVPFLPLALFLLATWDASSRTGHHELIWKSTLLDDRPIVLARRRVDGGLCA